MRWKTTALLALVIASLGLGQSASAQDGLQRFERDIKPQLTLKQFTYSGATALGASGFVLNNVVAVVPPSPASGGKDSTVRIDRVTVEEIDFDRMKKESKGEEVPRFAKLKLEGVNADESVSDFLRPYGIPKVPADFVLDYTLDPATKVLTLNKLELTLRGQARLGGSVTMDGISDKTSQVQGAKDDGRLRSAAIEFDDTGLLAKLLPAIAKEVGLGVEPLIMLTTAQLASFAQGQGPETIKGLDALISFVSDWKQPKGPIRISIKPSQAAGFADMDKIGLPNALTEVFGLTVDYAGTRPGASQAGGVMPLTSPGGGTGTGGGGGGGGPTQSGAEAWLSVVGNTLTGTIDGELMFEHYRKDGSLTLLQGSDVTTGRWSVEGEKVCFKYPDEDKECYSIQRSGEDVTLVGSAGKGFRLTVLAGNPKNL